MGLTYAKRMDNIKASEIRELLKLTQRPEIISFAGGLPAPELFPVERMKKAGDLVMDEYGEKALQYGPTDGFEPLREHIVERMKTLQIEAKPEDILVTNGSQQGLDFTARIFFDEGDIVLCESPSYLGAINAFKACGPKFIEVPTDENGMKMDELETILKENDKIKLIYVIPDFQNPTGRTWSLDRRKRLMELANEHNIAIVEDNPYGELRFEGEIPPSLKSLDTEGRVIFLGTFSKTMCPGLRIGWVCAEPETLNKYNLIKQGADLQASTISQMQLSRFLDEYSIVDHIETIKVVYRKRRDLMLKTMEEQFPAGVTFTKPEGGLFTWVVLPESINARDLAVIALEKKVAFVPGGSFYPNGGNENSLRLNYSNMDEERIVIGITKLADAIKEML